MEGKRRGIKGQSVLVAPYPTLYERNERKREERNERKREEERGGEGRKLGNNNKDFDVVSVRQ